jgi:hypothetical protein
MLTPSVTCYPYYECCHPPKLITSNTEVKRLGNLNILNIPDSSFRAVPVQVWTDSEGFKRLRLPDFKTIGT